MTRERVTDYTIEVARGALVEGIDLQANGKFKELRISTGAKVLYAIGTYSDDKIAIEEEVDIPAETAEPAAEPAAESRDEF